MTFLQVLSSISAVSCLGVAFATLSSRRLGWPAWPLALFLMFQGLAAAALSAGGWSATWSEASGLVAAYAMFILAAPAGLAFSVFYPVAEPRGRWRRWGGPLAVTIALALLLVVALGRSVRIDQRVDLQQIHSVARLFGLYVLVVAIAALASLERTFRSADEHVRWEVKFLFLALAMIFGVTVYLSSKVLLFAPSQPLLSRREFLYERLAEDSLRMLSVCLLPACALILLSLQRISGRNRVVVSHGLTFSTITLAIVGAYLITASIVSWWLSRTLGDGTELGLRPGEAARVLFILLTLLLAIVLLSTGVRHRIRLWIRRNIFTEQHDYRSSWLDATESIGVGEGPEQIGEALVGLVRRNVDAIDVSVWVRDPESDRLRLVSCRGPSLNDPTDEASECRHRIERVPAAEILGGILDGEAPPAHAEISGDPPREEHDGPPLSCLWHATGAALLVPLRSAGETLGLIAVGSDRSGSEYPGETREFLRVLASHAAGELHKAELLRARMEALEAEAFQTFATFLLHDLKNFATTLSMIGHNAATHGENAEFRRDAFEAVLSTATKMKDLCNSLRTFSPNLAAKRRLGDLSETVREVVESLRPSTRAALRCDLGRVPPASFDAEEIAGVTRNLILNADQATEGEGEVRISTGTDGSGVVLEVSDDGVGIPPEFLENELFLPFRTTKSEGLGIGLFQSKKIVEAHGGRIGVRSREGEGTTVRVTIPAEQGRSEERRAPST